MKQASEAENSILITGGAGFIGSNFIPFFLKENRGANVVNLDSLTYAGNLKYLESVENDDRYTFIHGDICDNSLVEEIFRRHSIKSVIHFAAESHVDNSIADPSAFIETNIKGTYVLLEAALKSWLDAPNRPNKNYLNARFHHISTDEVYGSLGAEGYFNEETHYAPNSPYSASKASSDFLVRSYHHTYGLNTVTSNCSNNYGPHQHSEKLIPTIIAKAIALESIPIYGDGKNVRDWLYVHDHCRAIERIFKKGRAGETYAIGGDNEYTNVDIANIICRILDEVQPKEKGSYTDQIIFVKNRPGHDQRYAIDASKIKNEIGWKAKTDFEIGLRNTVSWYIERFI